MTDCTPELPEGYFFRVSDAGFGLLRVALRKKLRWGSRRVCWYNTFAYDKDVLYAMGRLEKEAFHEPKDPCEKYLGDYPPKTIGGPNDAQAAV